jgi:hypothetical protein
VEVEVVQEIVVAYLVVQVEEVELFRVLEQQVLEQRVTGNAGGNAARNLWK